MREGGSGGLSLLAVAFIVMKLTGFIEWSWWWVLAPVWIPIALLLLVALIYGIVLMIKRRR